MTEPQAILQFWFGAMESGFSSAKTRARWFESSPAFDAEVRGQFGHYFLPLTNGEFDDWQQQARACLAFILIADQFSRNCFRDDPQAFATDGLALAAAKHAVLEGFDTQADYDERVFFYMPFEHSPNLVDQHTSVGLFTKLRDDTPAGQRHITGQFLRHAHQHRDTIIQFGEFPDRAR